MRFVPVMSRLHGREKNVQCRAVGRVVHFGAYELSPAHAREAARALLSAADRADALCGKPTRARSREEG